MSGVPIDRRRVLSGAAALSAAVLGGPAAMAQLRVDITSGVVQPVPIAVSPFAGDSPVGRRRWAPRSPRSSPTTCRAPACSR